MSFEVFIVISAIVSVFLTIFISRVMLSETKTKLKIKYLGLFFALIIPCFIGTGYLLGAFLSAFGLLGRFC